MVYLEPQDLTEQRELVVFLEHPESLDLKVFQDAQSLVLAASLVLQDEQEPLDVLVSPEILARKENKENQDCPLSELLVSLAETVSAVFPADKDLPDKRESQDAMHKSPK